MIKTPAVALLISGVFPVLALGQDIPLQSQDELEDGELIVLGDPSVILAQRANCRDMVMHVREEQGLPLLRREPVSPDEPMLVATVDYDLDGCDVLLTSDGPQSPPDFNEGPARRYPAQ